MNNLQLLFYASLIPEITTILTCDWLSSGHVTSTSDLIGYIVTTPASSADWLFRTVLWVIGTNLAFLSVTDNGNHKLAILYVYR